MLQCAIQSGLTMAALIMGEQTAAPIQTEWNSTGLNDILKNSQWNGKLNLGLVPSQKDISI